MPRKKQDPEAPRRGPGRPRKVVDEGDGAAKAGKPGRKPKAATAGDVKQTRLRCGEAVMSVRLELSAVGNDDTRYRLWWEVRADGRTERGCAGAWPTEELGREAFDAELKRARQTGWVDMFISSGRGRPIEIKPLPPPPSRSA